MKTRGLAIEMDPRLSQETKANAKYKVQVIPEPERRASPDKLENIRFWSAHHIIRLDQAKATIVIMMMGDSSF